MAGYIGTKAVNLSTTGADINGNANVDGTLDVTGAFTSLGIDDNATSTAITIDASGNVGIGTASPLVPLQVNHSGASGQALRVGDDTTNSSLTGLYLRSTTEGRINTAGGALTFGSAASGEWARIDSSGNVGIGTAAPQTKLEVSSPTSKPTVRVEWNQSNSDAAEVDRAQLQFMTQNFSGTSRTWGMSGYTTDLNSSFKAGLRFECVVGAATTEVARFDVGGSLLVGATTGVTGVTSLFQRGTVSAIQTKTGTSSGVSHIRFENSNGVVGSISTSGSATAYNTSSDYRLKENIAPVQGASDIVKAMRPVTYNFKTDSTDWHDGFLAHELQELHPRAVIGSKDAMQDEEYEVTPAVEATYDAEGVELTPAVPAVMGTRSVPDYQGVDYSKLTPILTAALKEALTKIEVLEAQNATFETRLAALEATP